MNDPTTPAGPLGIAGRTPDLAFAATRSRIAGLIGLVAFSLAVFSALHLSGTIPGQAKSHGPSDAGIAEAVICVVLLAGLIFLLRSPGRGRTAAIAATGFAILGFAVGLTSTVEGGPAIDLVYHLTGLPLLIVILILLVRTPAAPG
jgi:peptidoglycan/LPS O-acetylase OafA/YrhL